MLLADRDRLHASSPENAHHTFSYKPSLPIQIPNRRPTIASMICLSPTSPKSPDLIFDMSPLSSHNSPLSQPFSLGENIEPAKSPQEPLLYPFPRFSLQDRDASRRSPGSHPCFAPPDNDINIEDRSESLRLPKSKAAPRVVSFANCVSSNTEPSRGRLRSRKASQCLQADLSESQWSTVDVPVEGRASIKTSAGHDIKHGLMVGIQNRKSTRSAGLSFISNIR